MASRVGGVRGVCRRPVVRVRIVSATSVQGNGAPNDHFIARPDRCVL